MKVLLLDTNHERIKEGLKQLNMSFDEDYISSKEEIENKISLINSRKREIKSIITTEL